MSILHYFSGDEEKRSLFIFNLIAPLYSLIDALLDDNFKEAGEHLNKIIPLQNKTVLDVGTGTGAWGALLASFGASVTGVDKSPKMLKEAKKKHPELTFVEASAGNLSQFHDNTFDIVTASFVLHGVTEPIRTQFMAEMKRVSKHYVAVHDFAGHTQWFVRFLEFMERSDYNHFKQHFCEEIKPLFTTVKKIELTTNNGLYIAEK
jgi:ubiquinone/menaquinone biosynthesis C-methylase UbiE